MAQRKTNYPSQEYGLIEKLKPFLNFSPSKRYPLGVGDDAALRVCGKGEQLIFTADTFVENVHFSLAYMNMSQVGYKAMAVNVSDCAAMGALPDGAMVQIVFPGEGTRVEKSILSLYKGIHRACTTWNLPVIGGNLSRGAQWVIDIALIGRLSARQRALTRSGVQEGDILWVSGFPGESRAGLELLNRFQSSSRIPSAMRKLAARHIAPAPRIALGQVLGRNNHVHAVIDISDGISKEACTLAYENNLGLEIVLDSTCASPSLRAAGKFLKRSWQEWFLHGGEDYELMFAASPLFSPSACEKSGKVALRPIGQFTKKVNGTFFIDTNGDRKPLAHNGWDHVVRG